LSKLLSLILEMRRKCETIIIDNLTHKLRRLVDHKETRWQFMAQPTGGG